MRERVVFVGGNGGCLVTLPLYIRSVVFLIDDGGGSAVLAV